MKNSICVNIYNEIHMHNQDKDKTIRGSSIVSDGQRRKEYISLNKQFISPVDGFNNGKKTKTQTIKNNIKGDIDFTYLEGINGSKNRLNVLNNMSGSYENEESEQKFAIILILFSMFIFVGIFYISSTNITTKYTTVNIPIGRKTKQ